MASSVINCSAHLPAVLMLKVHGGIGREREGTIKGIIREVVPWLRGSEHGAANLSHGPCLCRFMPFLILSARLCPPGIEGTLFALFMSAYNFGNTLSGYMGATLASRLGITSSSFSNLTLAVAIQSFCTILPIFLLAFVPANVSGSYTFSIVFNRSPARLTSLMDEDRRVSLARTLGSSRMCLHASNSPVLQSWPVPSASPDDLSVLVCCQGLERRSKWCARLSSRTLAKRRCKTKSLARGGRM